MYICRECVGDDYNAIASIRNQVTVEQVTGDALRRSDEYTAAQPNGFVTRLVTEDASGEVVGYALVAHFHGMPPGRWWIHVTVRPELQRRGIGRQLYDAAEGLVREQGATEVESTCAEDPAQKNYAFAQALGFVSDRKRFEMVLDRSDWSAHLPEEGTRVKLLSGTPTERLLHSLYDLVAVTEPEVPSFEGVQTAFADWAATFSLKQQAVAVALEGERIVAASFIQLPREKAEGCYIGYTGVLPEHRGRGLGRAVKLLAIQEAFQRGYPFVWTHNDQDNPAIVKLNLAIGFRQMPGIYRLKKSVT